MRCGDRWGKNKCATEGAAIHYIYSCPVCPWSFVGTSLFQPNLEGWMAAWNIKDDSVACVSWKNVNYLSIYLKKCNFIYLTHPPPQGLNSLVLPIIWAEPAVVTVIIRIYGGQVLCVNHMLLSTHPYTSLKRKEEKKGKKGKEVIWCCAHILFSHL